MGREAKRQKPMTAEEQSVYMSLVKTARKAAAVFARRNHIDYEEAIAEAMLLLVDVVRNLQSRPGGNVKAFVSQRVRLRLIDAYRAKNTFGVSVCTHRTTKRNGFEAVRTHLGSDVEETPESLELQECPARSDIEAQSMIDRLKSTGVRWDMVEVLLGWTSAGDLSKRLGVHESRISQMRKQAIRLLQGVEWLKREVAP
jgi:DNA-directed RNA polymerase specialized sigma subunit